MGVVDVYFVVFKTLKEFEQVSEIAVAQKPMIAFLIKYFVNSFFLSYLGSNTFNWLYVKNHGKWPFFFNNNNNNNTNYWRRKINKSFFVIVFMMIFSDKMFIYKTYYKVITYINYLFTHKSRRNCTHRPVI